MFRQTATVVVGIVVLCGCAPTTPSVSLQDVKTSRVYSVERSKLIEAMRMYCTRYDFKLTGIEAETGRVRGYKRMETLREGETRTILMLVYVIAQPDGKSRVEAKFVYDKLEGTPTRQEESQLVDSYTSLFKYLDSAAE
ncbi:MAG TPA: hypothetical protein VMM37_01705 [Bacteroidota bacterium]|nr:hypothetical protein [Bacteroidota bacterium]